MSHAGHGIVFKSHTMYQWFFQRILVQNWGALQELHLFLANLSGETAASFKREC